MGGILAAFLGEARRRGIELPDSVTGSDVFAVVRDLPYRRPARPGPASLIAEWRGTCSGKHRLLAVLLEELGWRSRLMVATYRYRWPGPPMPPPALAEALRDGPVPDVHTFLAVEQDGGWLPVDATWPAGARRLGFPVHAAWTPGRAQAVACMAPFEAWPVPDGADADRYKAGVVAAWCGAGRARREALIAAFAQVMEAGP